MIAHLVRRLGALVNGPPRADYSGIPPSLLRDVGLAGPHAGRIGTAPAPDQREGDDDRPRRPFSFRIHPASELVELRDRSALASLPVFRHKGRRPLVA